MKNKTTNKVQSQLKANSNIIRAKYDAASLAKDSVRHFAGSDFLSADAAISSDVRRIIISRARYEIGNNGYGEGIMKTLAEDCIGTGPRLQLLSDETLKTDGKRQEIIEEKFSNREYRWKEWCKAVHLRDKLKICRRTKAQDGEVFIKKTINPNLDNEIKLDITTYEGDQIASDYFKSTEYYENGGVKEFDGIIYDAYGNVSKYRFLKAHPGNNSVINCNVLEADEVEAKNVIHYANIVRPGQHRGLSEIASTLPIFNDLRRFTNAVLSAAEIAAEIAFILTTDTPADIDPEGPVSNPDDPQGAEHLLPGTVIDYVRGQGISMPEGWKVNQLKSEQPTTQYSEFVKNKIREAARPLGMTLSVALGDSSGYNYASGRLDHQSYFKRILGERALIQETILDNLLKSFEMLDKIYYPEDYTGLKRVEHTWMWDGFGHTDPVKEANAQKTRLIDSQIVSRTEECAIEGKDYLQVLRVQAREKQLREKYGLTEATETTQTTTDSDDPEDDEDGKDDEK